MKCRCIPGFETRSNPSGHYKIRPDAGSWLPFIPLTQAAALRECVQNVQHVPDQNVLVMLESQSDLALVSLWHDTKLVQVVSGGNRFQFVQFVPGAIIGVWFVPLFSDRGTLGADLRSCSSAVTGNK